MQRLVKIIGIAGTFMFITFTIIQFALIPSALITNIKENLCLTPDTIMRNVWGRTPFPFEYRVYMFNITNPQEIHLGQKPIVQEIGPFVYDEWTEKTNQVDYEEDDTVSYTSKKTFYFNEEKSNGLTSNEELMLPNHFALAMFNAVMREQEGALPIVEKAVDSFYNRPQTIFKKVRVRDILFDGVLIDCSGSTASFSVMMVCMDLQENHAKYPIKHINDTAFSISLFGKINATSARHRTRVKRGMRNIKEVGQVVGYANKTNISVWDDKYCDTFRGTDGTIIHPLINSKGKDDILIYVPDFCRSVYCHFVSHIRYFGMSLLRYAADVGIDSERNPHDKCFCAKPDRCLKRGVFDNYKCARTPILITNPHFYNADPYYLTLVDGLKPDKEKHSVMLDVDAITGIPVRAFKRVQINMFLLRLETTRLMANMTGALLPLVWIDETIILPGFLLRALRAGLYIKSTATGIIYLFILAGLGMMGFAGYEYYKSRKKGNRLVDTKAEPPRISSPPKKNDIITISTVQASVTPPKVD